MKASSISYLSKNINVFGLFFLSLFLILNVVGSQIVPSIYFDMINERKTAVVSYLKKILLLPFYKKELLLYQDIYGSGLENEVLKEKITRNSMINKLEQILEKNPRERDVLYSLYLLNREDGNEGRAKEFLQKVKEVDPAVTN